MMRIEIIGVLLICLSFPTAAIAQDTNASTDIAEEDSHFLVFEQKDKQSISAEGDFLWRNRAVFDHADYCALMRSFRDVGPHSDGRGSGQYGLTSFLVLRDVQGYDMASRTFRDQLSGLDIEMSFEFPPGDLPPRKKKGFPPSIVMSLAVHRGKDDPLRDIERSEVEFRRDKPWNNGLVLTKLAVVGDTEYRYELMCFDPLGSLRFQEELSGIHYKR